VEKEKINPIGKRNESRKRGSTFFFPPRKGKIVGGKFVPPLVPMVLKLPHGDT